MNKLILSLFSLALAFNFASAQDTLFTKTGRISFYSKALNEDNEAHNKKVTTIVNTKTGAMEFGVLIKAFEFEKALMQEHFNENYMESDKYPKSTFVGKIDNLSEVKFEKDGVYTAKISGDLTIHGVTKKVNTTGTFTVKSGAVKGDATFMVLLEDYKIAIPAVVKDKVSKDIKVVVDVNLTRFGAK